LENQVNISDLRVKLNRLWKTDVDAVIPREDAHMPQARHIALK